MSILPRTSSVFLALALIISVSGCDFSAEKEASKRLGDQPKKTIDGVSSKVGNLMQQQGQGSERLQEEPK